MADLVQSSPAPVFEGSEKRIELDFGFEATPRTHAQGLRDLSRKQLDECLEQAECAIVSSYTNDDCDSYVLSESSLFVFAKSMVLKTCGTTKLLQAVPLILERAQSLGLSPIRVKYSRGSFLFPHLQPAPHGDFRKEVARLEEIFGDNGFDRGSAYVLGDECGGFQWHVYVATARQLPAPRAPPAKPRGNFTLEVCMTDLDPTAAALFYRNDKFVSAKHSTSASGIHALVPGAAIDDYVFEPCGYSMNGLLNAEFVTIHITPEPDFSYASIEFSGFPQASWEPEVLLARAVQVVRPGKAVAVLSFDDNVGDNSMVADLRGAVQGYKCVSATRQEVSAGQQVWYYSLLQDGAVGESWSQEAGGNCMDLSKKEVRLAVPVSVAGELGMEKGGGPLSPRSTESGASAASWEMLPDCGSGGSSSARVAEVLRRYHAHPLEAGDEDAMMEVARKLICEHGLEESFYMVDLGCVKRLYEFWEAAMPRIRPFYAVKCNPDPALISTLAALGAGFDCASENEVELVRRLGVAPENVVLANACKRPRDIRHAGQSGVRWTTFDTVCELQKIKKYSPGLECILRIRADDPGARCQLGNKYGCEEDTWAPLMEVAKELGLKVVGISFHVGSGARNPLAFVEAISMSRKAFDIGLAMGFPMYLLDIGGGFQAGMGSDGQLDLGRVPDMVNAALEEHFPLEQGVQVIAEPGRYLSELAVTFASMVYGRRFNPDSVDGRTRTDYWITDGLYGSFNCIPYDHAEPRCRPLTRIGSSRTQLPQTPYTAQLALPEGTLEPSTVFGPTCDGLDTVLRDCLLPELEVGDWLVWPNMGAYTIAGASNFNGINAVDVPIFYVASTHATGGSSH